MKLGVIGLGSIGARHATNARALGHDVWGYDANGAGDCHSLAGLVSVNPHAVLICTPAATHADVARQLLSLGYSGALFCEKPLALSVEECEVFRTWPHPVTMVGYMLRHHEKARAMKLLFPGPNIYPYIIRGSFSCWVDMTTWPGAGYGPLCLEASHELDLALWFGAPPLSKAIMGANEVRLEFRELVWSCPWHVQMLDSSVRYYRSWEIDADCDKGAEAIFESSNELGDQMYVDELAHFLACVEKNEPTITPFADGIRVVRVCEDAMKLAEAQ